MHLESPSAAASRRTLLRALGSCVLLGAGAVALPVPARAETSLPAARDLRASVARAARHGQPLVLMFSLPDCSYCEQVRRNTYRWLLRDGVDVQQLDMLPGYHLRDLDGRETNGEALAARYHVSLAPTVLFLGPGGHEIGERLVGAGEPDFYEAFVDRALQQAREHLKSQVAH